MIQMEVQPQAYSMGGIPLPQAEISVLQQGETRRTVIRNTAPEAIRLSEVLLARLQYPVDTKFYAEGYNMLSQYGGTLGRPELIGSYADAGHYRMPGAGNAFIVYNLLRLETQQGWDLYAFCSCRRFRGEFRIRGEAVDVVLALEGVTLGPGEEIELEEWCQTSGSDLTKLYEPVWERVERNHSRLALEEVPTGWCSWYCYGPDVTCGELLKNAKQLRSKLPELKYLLIDDGYQKHMGDWLEESEKLGTAMPVFCEQIRRLGMEPAVWVAPFIADADSRLLREHPDWMVQDEEGHPLSSEEVTFSGWRLAPWYMLDGSHPGAQAYLREVFSVMRNRWGCRYFKLDANMWGAIPAGRRFAAGCTAIEAYRSGMAAILEAIGEDGVLLGCNAPMWPSLGLVHAMRVSTDIARNWGTIRQAAQESFQRQYQNGHFWINDPDCAVYQDLKILLYDPAGEGGNTQRPLSENEKRFHLSAILAVAGVKFISDRITDWTQAQADMLQRVLQTDIDETVFLREDYTVAYGSNRWGDRFVFFFNPFETGIVRQAELNCSSDIREIWTDELIVRRDTLRVKLLPHSARIYRYR